MVIKQAEGCKRDKRRLCHCPLCRKSKVTYFNKGYATQNPKEYFADAYKDYILHRSSLSSTRPLTYKYVKAAVSKVNAMTSANFERMHKLYDSMWNKYGA